MTGAQAVNVAGRLALVVAILVVTSACATTRPRGLADRFIVHGTPGVDVGGPPLVMPGFSVEALREAMDAARARRSRPADGASPGRTSVVASSLESHSPRLRRALHDLAVMPTSERYLRVAQAYVAEGIPDRAYDYLAQGLTRDKRDPTLHDATARLWRDWGMLDRALTSAHTAVFLAPASPEARNTLGTVLWRLGRRGDAARAFEAAVALAPDAGYAWNNLCQTALAAGDTKTATSYCQRAARLKGRARRPAR